jgi:hypothetical protein
VIAAHHEIADDEQRPAVSKDFERDTDGAAGAVFWFGLLMHRGDDSKAYLFFASKMIRREGPMGANVWQRCCSRANSFVRHSSNGLPGFITLEADGVFQTTALEIEGGKVAAIYVMRNPDKLRHLH